MSWRWALTRRDAAAWAGFPISDLAIFSFYHEVTKITMVTKAFFRTELRVLLYSLRVFVMKAATKNAKLL